jgi:hypothetical protein
VGDLVGREDLRERRGLPLVAQHVQALVLWHVQPAEPLPQQLLGDGVQVRARRHEAERLQDAGAVGVRQRGRLRGLAPFTQLHREVAELLGAQQLGLHRFLDREAAHLADLRGQLLHVQTRRRALRCRGLGLVVVGRGAPDEDGEQQRDEHDRDDHVAGRHQDLRSASGNAWTVGRPSRGVVGPRDDPA